MYISRKLTFALATAPQSEVKATPKPTAQNTQAQTSNSRALVDINTASEKELKAVPGIGDLMRQRSSPGGRIVPRISSCRRRL